MTARGLTAELLFAAPRGLLERVMVHDLSHMLFGDAVSPWEWSDVWLNEGHATWYELTFADETGYLEDDTGIPGVTDLEGVMQVVYSAANQWRAQWGPVARPIGGDSIGDVFTADAYYGGALVLYALREEIGDAAFQRLEHEWIARHLHRSASTADVIALASEVAGRDLSGFLTAWLYGGTVRRCPTTRIGRRCRPMHRWRRQRP